jgi:hypothetical protein
MTGIRLKVTSVILLISVLMGMLYARSLYPLSSFLFFFH